MSEYSPELTPYNTQAQQASNHTERLVAGVGSLVLGLGGVRAAASGVAANFQSMMAPIAAATRVTHQSTATLTQDVQGLTRAFPMASREAVATVQAVQSLGLTAKGQERQVGALATTMERLGTATGSSAAQMSRDFGSLNREMGSLDPGKVSKMADVVTTLAARSGANATGIVQFAKTLSPLAQAAGVGQTALLGMSTSFSKLGDDGYVAANAVSKMMSDMNRAVRDGGTEMAGYANAVGMTVDQFKALYNADPSRAVASVTQAVGRMPKAQAQRTLDQLGIDGVRAQRVFLNQAQSGGMMADITAAERAYGNGSTAQASQTATTTVYANLTRLGNAAESVAFAFERPLLGAVNSLVNVAGGITRGAAGVLNAGPIHGAINVASQAALPLFAARMGYRALRTGAMGSFLLRSGPVTGALAGFRAGRYGGVDEAIGSVPRTQAVSNMLLAQQAGVPLGTNAFRAGVNERMMQAGGFMGAMFPAGGEGPGMFSRLRGYGVLGAGVGLRSGSEMLRLARMDPLARDNYLMRPAGSPTQRFIQNQASMSEAFSRGLTDRAGNPLTRTDMFRGTAKELDLLAQSAGKAGGAAKTLGGGIAELGKQATLTGGWMAGQAGKAGLSMLSGLVTNPLVLAGGGAMLGYHMYSNEQATHRRQDERTDNLDIFGAVNEYRNAMGKAGEASMTLSDQMTAASQTISASVTTMSEATRVSEQDRSAAAQNKTVLQGYSGNAAQVAAQIGMLNLNGMQPSDVQGAKLDLLRQQSTGALPPNFNINQALAQIPVASGGTLSSDQINAAVAGMAAAPGLGKSGFGLTSIQRDIGGAHRGGLWATLGTTGAGAPQLGKTGTQELSLLQGALGQERANLGSRYGDTYGARQTLMDADQAMKAALKTHNADLVVGMEQQLSRQLTGHSIRGLSAQDIQAQGFLGILQGSGYNVSGTNYRPNDLLNRGKTQTYVEDSVATSLQNMGTIGEGMARFFANATSGNAGIARGQRALTAADQAPEDLQKQHDAVMAIVDGGQKAGMTLGDLAAQAAKATTAMSDQDARTAVMVGVIAEAQRRLNVNLGGMTIGQRFAGQTDIATKMAGVTGQSQTAQDTRAQGQAQAASTLQDERSFMQQRIMVQRNFEIQSQRAQRDYHLQVARANEDFQTQQTYAEEDFYRQRGRAIRDFTIQQQRQIQDAAKTMYNPYQRVQVKPVWDAANLIGNRSEQIGAMRQQLTNIKKLRQLGLTQATIDQLSLYDPNNAQQAAELVGDLESDRGEAGQLNRQTGQAQRAAGALLAQDPSQRRAKEDFRRQLRDSQTDYNTAVTRQRAQFNLQMGRQQHDFQVQLGDAATDIKNADKEITGDMTTLQADMNRILHGQAVDWSKSLKNTLGDTLKSIKDTMPALNSAMGASISAAKGSKGGGGGGTSAIDVAAGTGGVVAGQGYGGPESGGNRKWTGGVKGFSRAGTVEGMGANPNSGFLLSKASKPGTDTDSKGNPNLHWGKDVAVAPDNRRLSSNAKIAQRLAGSYGWNSGPEWAALFQIWQQESQFSTTAGSPTRGNPYGIPQALWDRKSSVPPMAVFGKDWKTNPEVQITWGLDYINHRYGDPLGAWAHKSRTGWYAEGGIATAPHVGVVAEAGNPEAMIPLNAHGISVLAEALRTYLSPHDAAALRGGGASYAVHISNDTYHYDQGQHIHGAVTVKANSPAEWAASAKARARSQNLTAARGVNWSRSRP